MKKLMMSLVITLIGFSALADIPNLPSPRPEIEPGPVKTMKGATIDAMDALLSVKATDMKKFMSSGNKITAATSQAISPEKTIYTFTRQNCSQGGVVGRLCLGGAQMMVTITMKQQGEAVLKQVKSSVHMIRSLK